MGRRKKIFVSAMPDMLWSWPAFGTMPPTITRNGTLKRTTSILLFLRRSVLPIMSTVKWNAAELSQVGTRTTLKFDHAATTRKLSLLFTKTVALTEPLLPWVAVNRASTDQ